MWKEFAQPVDAAARCPRLLAVSVQAMDSDDTAIGSAVNASPSNEKHSRRSGWCLQLPLAGHAHLQQLPLLTLRMQRILQEPAGMLVRAKERSACETCLCVALLRAEVKEPSHRVDSDQGQKVCGVERRMCSSIVRKGCREAELRHAGSRGDGGRLVAVSVRCSARSARSSPRSL